MNTFKLVSIAAALSTLALAAASTGAMADSTDGSKASKAGRARVVVPTSFINKVSGAYDVADMSCDSTEKAMINRRILNTVAGSVIVSFTGEFFGGGRNILALRRNGVVVPGPGDGGAPMAAHDTNEGISMNGFTWTVPNVPVGIHNFTVTCQLISGTSALVDERSITVYHR